MKRSLMVLAVLMAVAAPVLADTKAPSEYGRIIISAGSQKAGLAPVVFDHWVHRSKFTCRLCHVDIGFGMKAGTTDIKAIDNMKGVYCGTCHNGKMQNEGRTVFAACSTDKSDIKRCERCHSQGKNVTRTNDFAAFAAKLPKDKMGNGVNWEKAAEEGILKPIDYIEGVSIKRPPQKIEQDFSIKPKSQGVSEIIFSHRKHAIWNGCEVCHPDIFMRGKMGTTNYSMKEINEGKFCGVCHTSIAFPVAECDRCHTKPAK